jgi:hypothetical protein
MSFRNKVAITLALVVSALPLHASDLKANILARENDVWRTFIGVHPDTEAFGKMALPDYLCIEPTGIVGKADNIAGLKNLTFSSYEIVDPQVRQISSSAALFVGRVQFKATAGVHDISGETFTSTVWVRRHGKWLIQLHTETPIRNTTH